MKLDNPSIIRQIDQVLANWREVQSSTGEYRGSEDRLLEAATSVAEAIRRFAPAGSSYRQQLAMANTVMPAGDGLDMHLNLAGPLRSLRAAYVSGYLETVEELVRADLFSDFLETAEYLLTEGYKDAAAVMIGGVLEEQLRKLSQKHGLPVRDGKGRALTGAPLNDSLAKSNIYNKLEQKNVVAWLDLRNKAAHGQYSEYETTHVQYLLVGVREFITRFPA